MRRWLRLGILFLLIAQGLCDIARFALPVASPILTASVQHLAVCHCRNCQSGKKCCCLKAANGIEVAQLRELCDLPEEATQPLSIAPRAAAPLLTQIPAPATVALPVAPRHESENTTDGRTPEPLTPPPSFLS